MRGAKLTREASDTFPGAGLVGYSLAKLVPLGILALSLVLVLAYYALRGSGTIKVAIERASDASDECFCVVASKSPVRPPVPDPQSFRAATRKAGAITQKRSATLVAASCELTVPPGTWHVHVYGTHVRGGVTLALPDTASCEVARQARRRSAPREDRSRAGTAPSWSCRSRATSGRGVAVWANDDGAVRVHTERRGRRRARAPRREPRHPLRDQGSRVRARRADDAEADHASSYPINLARELHA